MPGVQIGTSGQVEIAGLREVLRGMRALDASLPKTMRRAMNTAAQVVVDEARPTIVRRSGRAARNLRVASTQSNVRVRWGGARVPYAPWLEFGGRVGRNKSVVRTFRPEGRFIFPAYRRKRDDGTFTRVLSESINDAVRAAGLGSP
jgi:phage gpG-like protein